ncbi:MAG: gamma carbonic anhydrase family protein [Agromyces sp.]
MNIDQTAKIRSLHGIPAPQLDATAFVAAGAVIVGNVTLEAGASVWYNAVLRAESAAIHVGANSNLQDLVACHVDSGFPLTIGTGVSVGHAAVLHGCTIEDNVLIGMGARVLNGAVIGAGSLIAAGTVVLEGAVIPPNSLVAGVPGKVRRELTPEELDGIIRNAHVYLTHVAEHLA